MESSGEEWWNINDLQLGMAWFYHNMCLIHVPWMAQFISWVMFNDIGYNIEINV